MFLQGSRIYLREVRTEDVTDDYYRWMNDPEVTRYTEQRFRPQSKADIEQYVIAHSGKQDEQFFAIILRDPIKNMPACFDIVHIGNIKLGPINWIHRRADVSLLIGDRAWRGRGYGPEAIGLVCDYAFNRLGLHKLTAGVYASNLSSYGAFKKCGFGIEGRQKDQVWSDGKFEDVILMGRVKPG